VSLSFSTFRVDDHPSGLRRLREKTSEILNSENDRSDTILNGGIIGVFSMIPNRSRPLLPFLFWIALTLLVSAVVLTFAVILAPTQARAELAVRIVDASTVARESEPTTPGMEYRLRSRAGVDCTYSVDALDPRFRSVTGSGIFHTFPTETIHTALTSLGPLTSQRVEVTIYVLPGAGLEGEETHAIGDEIFLPAMAYPWTPELAAYVIVHEIGHVLQHQLMPHVSGRSWDLYLALRGLEDGDVFHENADHDDRPSEIFAEDFRMMFGGALARAVPFMAHEQLPHPTAVRSLEPFMKNLLLGGTHSNATSAVLTAKIPKNSASHDNRRQR